MLVLILVRLYKQMAKVAASRERVNTCLKRIDEAYQCFGFVWLQKRFRCLKQRVTINQRNCWKSTVTGQFKMIIKRYKK